jgi:GT2 family glycosyltransferase
MAILKEVFDGAGGFDEGYRNGMEDVDLCIRLKRKGFRHYVAHRSVVLHHVSASPGRHLRNAENTARFRERHAAYCARFGRQEWPAEYLRRYARHWWKMEPRKLARALFLLMFARRPTE